MLSVSVSAQSTTVVLKPEVFVVGPKLSLGEIAEITGDSAESLQELELGYAPIPNQSKTLQASLIKTQILHAGFEEQEIAVQGAPFVRITTRAQTVSKNFIEKSLLEFIEWNLPWDPANTFIDLQVPSLEFSVPEGEITIVWRVHPQYRFIGTGLFKGEIKVNGITQKTISCRATIEAYGSVVVAATSIPRGQTIRPEDLTIEQHPIGSLPRDAITDPSDVTGQVAIKTIYPDQIITRRLVTAPIIVRKNQIVTAETVVGGLIVRTRVKALVDGKEGSVILCENPDSKQQFTGEVRKDGTIRVY